MSRSYLADSILINKFQKASDWTQDHLGFNNFAIARFLRIVMLISLSARVVFSIIARIDANEIIVLSCSATILVKMELIAKNAKHSLKNKDGLMNPVANDYAAARVIIQFVSLAAVVYLIIHLYQLFSPSFINVAEEYGEWKEVFWDFFGILLFPVAYFSSCTPKPYDPSRVRKFSGGKLRQRVLPVALKRTLP